MNTPRTNDSVRKASTNARPSSARRETASGGDDFSSVISLGMVADFLRRWWLIATPIGLLLAGGAAAYLLATFKEEFMATNLMIVKAEKPFVAFDDEEKSDAFVANQMQLIRSSVVLEKAVAMPEIAELPEIKDRGSDAVAFLANRLIISNAGGGSDYFQISLALEDRDHAALIVDAVADSYFKVQQDQEEAQAKEVIKILTDQEVVYTGLITDARAKLKALSEGISDQAGLVSNPAQFQFNLGAEVTLLRQQLSVATVNLQTTEARIQALQERLKDQKVEVSHDDLERTIDGHEQVLAIGQAIAAKRLKMQEYAAVSRLKEKDPGFVSLAKEIETDEQSLELVKKELRTQVHAGMTLAVAAQNRSELATLVEQLTIERIAENLANQSYQAELGKAKTGSTQLLEVEFARAKLAQLEDVHTLISSRIVALETEMNAPSRFKIEDSAKVSLTPVEIAPFKNLAVATAGGFFLPFALIFLWERTLRRISDARSLEKQIQLPVIGEVSMLPARQAFAASTSSKRRNRELHLFRESINSLRTYLMLSRPVEELQVLSINSACSGEGKSSVSAQLAMSLAQATGELTLIIDGDVRLPDAHDIFGCPLGPGLVDVLQGHCDVNDAIVRNLGGNIHVLPAGKLSSSPHKLFGGDTFERLLDELRGTYRHIIVDTPPVLAASESLFMAKVADACLLCTLRDVSRIDQVKAAYAKLEAAGANPVGLVLSGVPTRLYAYNYGGYGYAAT